VSEAGRQPLSPPALVEGDTGFMPLADLFLWLERNARSSRLELGDPAAGGRAFRFVEGRLAETIPGDPPGEPAAGPFERAVAAFAAAVSAGELPFRLVEEGPAPEAGAPHPPLSPGEVVMEALKRLDETRRSAP